MKVVFFANRMPDLCGAFLHDIDLATELQKRGHGVMFATLERPKEGYSGGVYRGFRFMHFSAATTYLDASEIWICPHAPVLPFVRKINSRGMFRPIVSTCHFDNAYNAISLNASNNWNEMLFYINNRMESGFRKNVTPWPSSIVKTDVTRPIMREENVRMDEPPTGECITLVNANLNKGVVQFIELAKRMPERKFLAVMPYYGELHPPQFPANVETIPFQDDVRVVLKKTRILLLPSFYESFARIAVECMYNGIPVLYSKPEPTTKIGGMTEGVEEWIAPTGIQCRRDIPEDWIDVITSFDDPATYAARSAQSIEHIKNMDLFTESTRIAQKIEAFSRENPVKVQSSMEIRQQAVPQSVSQQAPVLRPPPAGSSFGLSTGRLRIRR
jgi:Glycosyl transferases group 1